MTVQQMRNAIVSAYPGPKWARRVDKMSDDQVLAVFTRLLNADKL